jgi:hypothetical protein
MTTDDIISESFNLFDETSDKSSPASKYDSPTRTWPLRQVNLGYAEICREARCSRTTDVLTTTANQREYTYPTGFVAMRSIDYNGLGKLTPVAYQNIEVSYLLNAVGIPIEYYLEVDKMGINPIPADAYTLNRVYFDGPTADLTLTDTPSKVPTAWHYLISYFLVAKMFAIDKGTDSERAIYWGNEYQSELTKFKNYLSSGMNADRALEL